MNKAEIKAETLLLVGEVSPLMTIPPKSLEDAVLWAQEALAVRLGLTYVECDPLTIDTDGITVLPDPLIKSIRVWYDDSVGGG